MILNAIRQLTADLLPVHKTLRGAEVWMRVSTYVLNPLLTHTTHVRISVATIEKPLSQSQVRIRPLSQSQVIEQMWQLLIISITVFFLLYFNSFLFL